MPISGRFGPGTGPWLRKALAYYSIYGLVLNPCFLLPGTNIHTRVAALGGRIHPVPAS